METLVIARWHVAAPVDDCWCVITETISGVREPWWRGVVIDADGPARPGARLRLIVRSPFGYRLAVDLHLVAVAARRRIIARADGDLRGGGLLDLRADSGDRTAITIRWEVQTRRAWMTRTAPLLAPVFRLAHALVMRRGLVGFRRALRQRASELRNAGNRAQDAGTTARAE